MDDAVTRDPFVLDPLRNTFRCQHCRAEIHVDRSLVDVMNDQSDFVERHLACPPAPVPAPVDVTGTPGVLRRDHQGLWSGWQRMPGINAWQVAAVTKDEAVMQLLVTRHTLQQRVTLLGSTFPRDTAELELLAQVLASEGHIVDVAVAG